MQRILVLLIDAVLEEEEDSMKYVSPCYKERTQEDIMEQERRFKLYEYYGIPYGIFDDVDEKSDVEADREWARHLIMQGLDIPKELEERVLKYKEQGL